ASRRPLPLERGRQGARTRRFSPLPWGRGRIALAIRVRGLSWPDLDVNIGPLGFACLDSATELVCRPAGQAQFYRQAAHRRRRTGDPVEPENGHRATVIGRAD